MKIKMPPSAESIPSNMHYKWQLYNFLPTADAPENIVQMSLVSILLRRKAKSIDLSRKTSSKRKELQNKDLLRDYPKITSMAGRKYATSWSVPLLLVLTSAAPLPYHLLLLLRPNPELRPIRTSQFRCTAQLIIKRTINRQNVAE